MEGAYGRGGGFFLPLSSQVLCRARFLLGRVDKYSVQSDPGVYPNVSPREGEHFGRSRLQRGTGERAAAAPLTGPAQGQR